MRDSARLLLLKLPCSQKSTCHMLLCLLLRLVLPGQLSAVSACSLGGGVLQSVSLIVGVAATARTH